MLYMLLNDRYFNFADLILIEIAAKLGNKNGRSNNVYFSRFVMMITNHVSYSLIITNEKQKDFG